MKPKFLVKGRLFEMFSNPFKSQKTPNLWKTHYYLDNEGVVKLKEDGRDVFNLKAME